MMCSAGCDGGGVDDIVAVSSWGIWGPTDPMHDHFLPPGFNSLLLYTTLLAPLQHRLQHVDVITRAIEFEF